ncbi:hypothetical protein BDV24DRAFT_72218 [Aspergillus arachidicola]|uniref:Uncharacterized protein n=1 Tax=Aspergillus arachidicola TaxID=656916 RepID=A0A5N6Y7Q9_9EURO|nr:hypothetical protein BDV24DRAFT_72218 [Aspergillus arachidicola]
MAFSFGASSPAGGNIPAELGPELPEVSAEVRHALMPVIVLDFCKRTNSGYRKLVSKVSRATATSDYFPPLGLIMPFQLLHPHF